MGEDYKTTQNQEVGSIYSIKLSDEKHGHQANGQIKKCGWNDRHTFALMNLLGQCIAFMNRGCLSVAIVAMVSSSNSTREADGQNDACPVPESHNDTLGPEKEGEFNWDEQLQGVVLGSFFYGYASSCFIGGILTDYFGGRLMFGVSIMGLSLLSVLSPISARTSVELFIANKVISGMLQGPMYPSFHSLMASRIPLHLRAKYNSICLTGSTFGNVFAMALGGVMASSSFLGGWPSVFYVFGASGILWSILWFFLIEEIPKKSVLPPEDIHSQRRNKLKEVHFKNILTSAPFWCLVFFHFGDSFGYYMLSTEIPTYLNNIQHVDLAKNGLLSALPYILQIFFSMAWGIAINRLIISGRISILASRRISSAVGMYCAGLALVAMCFVNCNFSLAVAVLCIAVAITGASNSGGYLGEQDMCPPSLVGVIKGMSNTLASTTGFIAPLVTGSIIVGNETLSAWRTAFLIAAALYIIPGTIYLVFMTEKVQPWIKSENKMDHCWPSETSPAHSFTRNPGSEEVPGVQWEY
ncbi:putative inorganic phosphate cotransporter isoform X2 [Palaemon carinicauda]|uniref:putative inorganic phosphate cotransporter isoform X2 n=1 Tax=Palaemon carinicauda TaxID=392227 RepID=UPI0035B5CDDA